MHRYPITKQKGVYMCVCVAIVSFVFDLSSYDVERDTFV